MSDDELGNRAETLLLGSATTSLRRMGLDTITRTPNPYGYLDTIKGHNRSLTITETFQGGRPLAAPDATIAPGSAVSATGQVIAVTTAGGTAEWEKQVITNEMFPNGIHSAVRVYPESADPRKDPRRNVDTPAAKALEQFIMNDGSPLRRRQVPTIRPFRNTIPT